MYFYLALDAGGTKTDFVLADESRELARWRTGTIKRMRADDETATSNLDRALVELSRQSGIPMASITRTCIGMAGDRVPLVADWIRNAVRNKIGGELLLLSDVEIALDAAFMGGPGVLVLAGTGSNVAGRDERGRIFTAGGWGPVLAEQGSGHRIGHQALRALFLAHDERRSTLLVSAVLKFWKLNSLDSLVAHANSFPPPDFSELPRLVSHCAEQGDEVARFVLCQQGRELGYLVCLVIDQLVKEPRQMGWMPTIAFSGSIMAGIPSVRNEVIATVRQQFPFAPTRVGVVEPLAGALWRAREGGVSCGVQERVGA